MGPAVRTPSACLLPSASRIVIAARISDALTMPVKTSRVAAPTQIVAMVVFVRTMRVSPAVGALRIVRAVKFVRIISVSPNQGAVLTRIVVRGKFARISPVSLAVELIVSALMALRVRTIDARWQTNVEMHPIRN